MATFPEAPAFLDTKNYTEIHDLMVPRQKPLAGSFSAAMAHLTAINPDLFLFTHQSAVPVADSVRAYYEELGYETPEIGVINTKEENRDHEYFMGADRALHRRSVPSEEVLEREYKRLKDLTDGKRVAVIDQFVVEKGTLLRAQAIAKHSGATEVRTSFRARWYLQASETEVNITEVTSVHAPFMRKVGHAAAGFELPDGWQEAYLEPESSSN